MDIVKFLGGLSQETEILLVLSIILFSGFIMTRLTNTLNMPKVSGYILAGILIGPCCLDFIPGSRIQSMGFVSDIALAFIAFGVGKFFKKEVLMQTGKRIIVITFSEALMAGVLVTLLLKLLFGLDWGFALILGAIATATAPASTMMTINQYKAKGEFVNTLLQIVALDDVVCLLAFSIVSAVITGIESGSLSFHDILLPIAYNIIAIALGVFCGYFLSRLLVPARSRDNRLILAIAMLLGLSGLCAIMDISPLLSCMVFGAVYINLTRDKKLFRQINNFTPPVMSVFFIVSGMNLDLNALTTVGAIGVSYFLIRIAGKYLGTYLSCQAMGTSREIRNYMGLALIPQAGVAIGLAFLGQRILPEATGNLMLTIILSSSVLYEMVGPISAKAALFLSGSISKEHLIEKELHETEDGRIVEKGPEEAESDERSSEEKRSDQTEAEADSRQRSAQEQYEASEETGTEAWETENEVTEDEWTEGDKAVSPHTADFKEQAEESSDLQENSEQPAQKKKKGKKNKEKQHKIRRKLEEAIAASSEEDHSQPGPEKSAAKKERESRISEDLEEYTEGLPELHEYNKGVDERDDYDVERIIKPAKNRKEKGKKKKKKSTSRQAENPDSIEKIS